MIQDIAPHVFHNHYLPEARVRPGDPVLLFQGEGILCRILTQKDRELDPEAFRYEELIHDGTGRELADENPEIMEFPRWREILKLIPDRKAAEASDSIHSGEGAEEVSPESCLTYLFTIDEENYFLLDTGLTAELLSNSFDSDKKKERNVSAASCAENSEEIAGLPDFHFCKLRDLREKDVGPKVREFAAMTALHLSHWYRNNQFCGRCGSKTKKDTKERALRCPVCGNVIYPRIVPAVIVGILNPDKQRMLVTKYRVGYGHYALVAGFTEIGESLEGTVRREVMEETGLKVKNIRYYKSQPWGIVDDILAGFYCDVDGDDAIRMDRGELKVAEWVRRDEIELQPQDFSLTNEMMWRFKSGGV